jgi:outer membrane protein assembly factor BamE (lipoprotein component of BamABCDE complex)
MKNPINLVFVVLVLAVLGCSCPRLEELTRGGNSSSPRQASNSAESGTEQKPVSEPSSVGQLTMDQFRQLKDKMSKSEVERILGGPGTEVSSSSGGGMTFSVYKWEGEDYKTVIVSFQDDKVISKSQVGLK